MSLSTIPHTGGSCDFAHSTALPTSDTFTRCSSNFRKLITTVINHEITNYQMNFYVMNLNFTDFYIMVLALFELPELETTEVNVYIDLFST